MALAQSKPADARRQTLKGNSLARHIQPALNFHILRKQRFYFCVCLVNILGIAGESDPSKGALTLAEQGPDVSRNKAGEIESIVHALVERDLPDVVSVID